MKNAVVYSFHVREPYIENNRCFNQLKYSIKTLRDYNKDIPVKVYISSTYNINMPIIPEAQVIYFENNTTGLTPKYWIDEGFEEFLMHRWQNAYNAINSFGFDNILYLDTDTIFHKDPENLFSLYGNTDFMWSREDNSKTIMDAIEMSNGMNDGQFIISSKIANEKELLVSHQIKYINHMLEKYKDILNPLDYRNFNWVIIQYAAFDYFMSTGNRVRYFDSKHVMISTEPDYLNTDDLILHHYFSPNTSRYVKNNNISI